MEGADGAISAQVAVERNRAPGRGLSLGEEQMRADLVREGRLRELAALGNLMFTRNATRAMYRETWRKPVGF